VRKLAVEAADNGLLAPELAAGITRVKGVASKGVRLGNWLSASVPSPARTELLSRAPGWAAWFHLVIAKSVPDRTHA
jgi:hypothetical protein